MYHLDWTTSTALARSDVERNEGFENINEHFNRDWWKAVAFPVVWRLTDLRQQWHGFLTPRRPRLPLRL